MVEAYDKYAKGATVIFASSVIHAEMIAKKIEGAVVVTGETKNRDEIIKKFTERKIPCIVNCMVFTEGTDIPLIETIIIARPTSNESLYTQMVGRGLRLYEGKEKLTLIDCMGITGKLNICTAPSLLGIDTKLMSEKQTLELQGSLLEMERKIEKMAYILRTDIIKTWITGAKKVNLFQKEEGIDIGTDNYIQLPNGMLRLYAGDGYVIKIPASDALGETQAYIMKNKKLVAKTEKMDKQMVINSVHNWLNTHCASTRTLWDRNNAKWGKEKASKKQRAFIRQLMLDADQMLDDSLLSHITKGEASFIIEQLKFLLTEKNF